MHLPRDDVRSTRAKSFEFRLRLLHQSSRRRVRLRARANLLLPRRRFRRATLLRETKTFAPGWFSRGTQGGSGGRRSAEFGTRRVLRDGKSPVDGVGIERDAEHGRIRGSVRDDANVRSDGRGRDASSATHSLERIRRRRVRVRLGFERGESHASARHLRRDGRRGVGVARRLGHFARGEFRAKRRNLATRLRERAVRACARNGAGARTRVRRVRREEFRTLARGNRAVQSLEHGKAIVDARERAFGAFRRAESDCARRVVAVGAVGGGGGTLGGLDDGGGGGGAGSRRGGVGNRGGGHGELWQMFDGVPEVALAVARGVGLGVHPGRARGRRGDAGAAEERGRAVGEAGQELVHLGVRGGRGAERAFRGGPRGGGLRAERVLEAEVGAHRLALDVAADALAHGAAVERLGAGRGGERHGRGGECRDTEQRRSSERALALLLFKPRRGRTASTRNATHVVDGARSGRHASLVSTSRLTRDARARM